MRCCNPPLLRPQYLKELGPESQVPDQFGNFAIDFAPGAGAPPGVLGAWGPSATATAPVDSTAQAAGAPTMLTSQLQHQTLESGPVGTAGGAAALQRAASEGVQQPARSSRARKGAGTTAAPSTGGRAASAASRGSRETKKEIDMKKHLALQEKNRRAQRRFRERQKQRVRGRTAAIIPLPRCQAPGLGCRCWAAAVWSHWAAGHALLPWLRICGRYRLDCWRTGWRPRRVLLALLFALLFCLPALLLTPLPAYLLNRAGG